MTPLLLVPLCLALLVVIFGLRHSRARRRLDPVTRALLLLPRLAPPERAPPGTAFEELVLRVQRELAGLARWAGPPAPGVEVGKDDFRRVIEHIADAVCPVLNAIERHKLIETVLGRIPRFAPQPDAAEDPSRRLE